MYIDYGSYYVIHRKYVRSPSYVYPKDERYIVPPLYVYGTVKETVKSHHEGTTRHIPALYICPRNIVRTTNFHDFVRTFNVLTS